MYGGVEVKFHTSTSPLNGNKTTYGTHRVSRSTISFHLAGVSTTLGTGYVRAGLLQDISWPNENTNLEVLLTRRPELNAHIADARLYITQRLKHHLKYSQPFRRPSKTRTSSSRILAILLSGLRELKHPKIGACMLSLCCMTDPPGHEDIWGGGLELRLHSPIRLHLWRNDHRYTLETKLGRSNVNPVIEGGNASAREASNPDSPVLSHCTLDYCQMSMGWD